MSTNCCKRALHLGDGAIYTYSSLHYHGVLTTVGFLKTSRDVFILQVRSQEAVVWILNGRLHPWTLIYRWLQGPWDVRVALKNTEKDRDGGEVHLLAYGFGGNHTHTHTYTCSHIHTPCTVHAQNLDSTHAHTRVYQTVHRYGLHTCKYQDTKVFLKIDKYVNICAQEIYWLTTPGMKLIMIIWVLVWVQAEWGSKLPQTRIWQVMYECTQGIREVAI